MSEVPLYPQMGVQARSKSPAPHPACSFGKSLELTMDGNSPRVNRFQNPRGDPVPETTGRHRVGWWGLTRREDALFWDRPRVVYHRVYFSIRR